MIGDTESARLAGLFVTPEFFNVFGVPLVGRGFLQEDLGTRPIVLGHEVWRRQFDGNKTLVGSTLDSTLETCARSVPLDTAVVGVAAASVRFPR